MTDRDDVIGPNGDDLGLGPWAEDEALIARIRASYASLPSPDAAQIARCATAVLAQAMHAPAKKLNGALRPRWWWGAAAAAALLITVTVRPWRRDSGAPAGMPRGTTVVGATVESGDAVRFDLQLPNKAKEVSLVGDFNGWDENATPMVRRGEDGTWSARVPLEPGRHVYAFVIDGQRWLVDPLAPQVPDEGYGPANAVVVDGAQ